MKTLNINPRFKLTHFRDKPWHPDPSSETWKKIKRSCPLPARNNSSEKLENSVRGEVFKTAGSKFVNWWKMVETKGQTQPIRWLLGQSRFHFLSSVKRRLITRTYGIGVVPYCSSSQSEIQTISLQVGFTDKR